MLCKYSAVHVCYATHRTNEVGWLLEVFIPKIAHHSNAQTVYLAFGGAASVHSLCVSIFCHTAKIFLVLFLAIHYLRPKSTLQREQVVLLFQEYFQFTHSRFFKVFFMHQAAHSIFNNT